MPWYFEKGPESDVVISSRIRLARNFKDYPFPFRATPQQAQKVLSKVRDAIFSGSNVMTKEFRRLDTAVLSPLEWEALVEKHLISPNFSINSSNSGLIISRDEKVSIMVNEEDHLRIQCMNPGFQIEPAWDMCNKIDNLLDGKIEFAFDNKYGYLTCCPTNVGTGIRVSVMLHLPALTMTNYIKGILEVCSKLSVAVRGLYGENTEASGNMFQISNQLTLGQSEEEIITNLTNIAKQVIEQERTIRSELLGHNRIKLEDRIHRSLGIFKNARVITLEESMKLISDIRLGIYLGIIGNIKIETLNELILLIQPANLQIEVGRQLKNDETDIIRAEMIRNRTKE